MEEHARLLQTYEAAGGLTYENRVRSTLRELGFGDDAFDQPVGVLSGGQAKLVGLARLMVWAPDLLLLDEPDNHLDLEGKERVERLVCGYPGAVVIVSHDRYLLDETVKLIAELERGQIAVWPGTYSNYAVNKQLAMLRQEQLYRAQQKRIVQIEAAIKRFEEAAAYTQDERHARQARHRHKMLERMDKVERPQEASRMRLELGGWRGQQQGARCTADRQVVRGRGRRPARGSRRRQLPGLARRAGRPRRPKRRGQVRPVPLHPRRGARSRQSARRARRRRLRRVSGGWGARPRCPLAVRAARLRV